MRFSKLGLSEPILKALEEKAYAYPTEVQKKTIPIIQSGRDLIASAATGTGKTASYVLPLLERYSTQDKPRAKRIYVLILVPTRELAVQVDDNIKSYAKHLDVTSLAMVGGEKYDAQKQSLIEGVDILVATPGRLIDMVRQRAVYFDEIGTLVLDEADRMLDMGFIDEINEIVERLPGTRQNLLFSATLSRQVKSLSETIIHEPEHISVTSDKASAPKIKQWLVAVDKHNKSALLSHLITEREWQQAIIFIRTQHGAAKLVTQLEKRGIQAESIHGGRSQKSRNQIFSDFKSRKIQFLVATGIASRGLDINELERVVNYDLPDDADEYIHRIGRTGRAGASGEAISLVSKDDFKRLCAIERRQDFIVDRVNIEGFDVVKDLPESNLNFVLVRK